MEKIFVGVLHMGISAGYLILAVLAVRFLLKKAPKTMRMFLWLLVGIRLLLPISIESAFSLIPDTQSVNEQINDMEMPKQAENTSPKAAPGLQSPLPAAETRTELPKTMVNATPLYLRFGTGIWIAGMIIMAVYMTISWIRLANRVKTAVPVDISVDETQKVRVYQSERIDSPFLFGIIRPRIYIPESIEERDIPYVVLHEKTHRERKDYLIKLAGFLILGVYWFHPLVWTAYIMLCRDIELICDEQVIRKLGEQCKKAYSQALLASAAGHRMISACPVAFGEIGIRERVKNVLNYKKPAFWVIMAAILACVAVPVCFMTQQKAGTSKHDFRSLAGIYEMTGSKKPEYSPELTLDEKGGFTFSYDMLSAYLSYGSYELNGTILTAATSDGKYHYQFTLTDSGELVFQEAQSSKITLTDETMGITVRDGSVFARTEKNPQNVPETEETQNASGPAIQNQKEIERWAQAFCARDGKTIADMLEEGARQELTDKCNFTRLEDGSIEFGFSSPWPWATEDQSTASRNYRIVSLTEASAEILYYAWVSDPHVTVWREQLTYKMNDGKCMVTSESIQFMDYICTAEEFEQAYPMQAIAGTMMDYYSYNGTGETLNTITRGMDETLLQPDTAAVYLLNLLNNPNKVSTKVVKSGTDENTCNVIITFQLAKKKSINVTMIRPYGKNSIWVPYGKTDSNNKNISYNEEDLKEISGKKADEDFDAAMPRIGYSDDVMLVLYDSFGVYIFDLESSSLIDYIDFKQYHLGPLQGEQATSVSVTESGKHILLSYGKIQLVYNIPEKKFEDNVLNLVSSATWKPKPSGKDTIKTAEYYSISDIFTDEHGADCFLAIDKKFRPNFRALLYVVSEKRSDKVYTLFK